MLNEISLSKFLARYLNLTGEDLSKVHHDDIKELFPELKRATFDKIRENPMLVASGEILLVNDGKKVIPYYVPITKNNELEGPLEFSMETVDNRRLVDHSNHDYTEMNVYELRQLLRRKFSSFKNQRGARRELEDRRVVLHKKYDRNKEKRKVDDIINEGY